MKAAVLNGINQITYTEYPNPRIDDTSILVKVKACAICGSDIRILHSGNNRVRYPAIIGHEIAGEVAKTGKNVSRFKVGDRVAIGADVPCGECIFCEAGIGNNCQINYAIGYQFPGGFAEYIHLNKYAVNYGPIHSIPDHLSYEEAALAEPLGCVLNALSMTPVKLGDTVVVIGAGPLGCMLVEAAKLSGARKVILVQRSRPRLEMAKKIVHADLFVSSNEEDAIKRVLDETGGLGADVIFTACPNPEAQQDALHMAKNRAFINFFGGSPKEKAVVALDTNIIHYQELIVTGSHGAMPVHHQKAIDLIASGSIDIKPYISGSFSLSQINEAFLAAENHLGMRYIVKP